MKLKQIVYIVSILFLFSSCKQENDTDLVLHNKKVLILGNSITQNGKYVDFIEYFLRRSYPDQSLDIISVGLSSETVSGDSESDHAFPRPGVLNRLNEALGLTKPDIVLACYGMNDGIFSQKDPNRFENYKNGIQRLINTVENTNAKIILLTPTPFDPDPIKNRVALENQPQSYKNPYYNYDQVLYDYSQWLKSIHGVKVIDLHNYLTSKLIEIKTIKPDSTFIPDGVHPNTVGHYLMAQKILDDLYPELETPDYNTEKNSLNQDLLFKLTSNRRKLRSYGWLKYIGYTRQENVKSEDIKTTKESVKQMDFEINKMQQKTIKN